MEKFILAIDQGTTGTTVLIINKEGEIISRGYKEFTQIYPKAGWVEHNPEEIWEVTLEVINQALEKNNIKIEQIYSIGITNQRETTVLWEKNTSKPIYNAIVWQCRRTSEYCNKLKEKGLEEIIKGKTGLVLDPYFSATKINWILNNIPNIKDKAEKGEILFGTIDTWLLYKLTKGKSHFTDHTNSSRTLLYNICTKEWDKELLEIFEIPEKILPIVKNSADNFGVTDKTLFKKEIPITGVAGDQQAALFGQTCWEPGTVKNTYGTGCFLMINLGNKPITSKYGLLTTLACDSTGKPVYALEGSIFITGAAVQWLRDELKIIEKAEDTEEIAKSIPDTKGVYIVPAFTGLGAPYWKSDARGAIVGLTRGSGRKEIIRAVLESIAYQTRDIIEIINQETELTINKLNVDGGAVKNNFLMQFQADILNIPVDRPKIIESTGLGAGLLAGLGSKFWKDSNEIKNIRKCDKLFTPSMGEEKRESLYKGWKKAVERVLL